MNKRQSRAFAIACTGLAGLAFLLLTIDSHRQFGKLTHSDQITPAVTAGMDVWHANNCINCHTLFGEGAYYAPDLTKITQLRGAQYLHAYLKDPARFYNEQTHRRLMPKQNLSDADITNLIAFLDWVSKVDNQGWPPRPILVTGSSIPGMDLTPAQQAHSAQQESAGLPPGARPVSGSEDPIALGQALFRSVAPACNACHSTAPGVNLAGPTLAGVGSRAGQRIASADYHGEAKDAAGYLRESILTPSAYVVPGPMYSADGTSFMPNTYHESLSSEQVDQLVAFLGTLK
jgi:nitric oxide reductase subunit C